VTHVSEQSFEAVREALREVGGRDIRWLDPRVATVMNAAPALLAAWDARSAEVERLAEELRVQKGLADALQSGVTLNDRDYADFMQRLHKARLIGEAARMDDQPFTANPFTRETERDGEVADEWEYGWRHQDCIENAHAARIESLTAERDEALSNLELTARSEHALTAEVEELRRERDAYHLQANLRTDEMNQAREEAEELRRENEAVTENWRQRAVDSESAASIFHGMLVAFTEAGFAAGDRTVMLANVRTSLSALTAAKKRIGELTEYVAHDDGCTWSQGRIPHCTCGLTDALKETPK
jgi:hypothetical protein